MAAISACNRSRPGWRGSTRSMSVSSLRRIAPLMQRLKPMHALQGGAYGLTASRWRLGNGAMPVTGHARRLISSPRGTASTGADRSSRRSAQPPRIPRYSVPGEQCPPSVSRGKKFNETISKVQVPGWHLVYGCPTALTSGEGSCRITTVRRGAGQRLAVWDSRWSFLCCPVWPPRHPYSFRTEPLPCELGGGPYSAEMAIDGIFYTG